MKRIKEKLNILIMSCDKNVGLLNIFFKYLYKSIDINCFNVYLSLEKEKYKFYNYSINVINSLKNSFSDRLKFTLECIDSESIVLLLDDFIIEDKIDYNELCFLNDVLLYNSDIATFIFSQVDYSENNNIYYNNYHLLKKYAKYKLCLQAALWRKDALCSLLNDHENPWEIEIFGTIRTYNDNKKYFSISDKSLSPIKYNDGFYVLQGKVNTLEKVRLEKKFNDNFSVTGLLENNGIVVRDNIGLIKRIIRRFRIIIYYIFYRFLKA